jgi:uncharacterized membrane protein YoaK (UPF0700 family)
MSSDPKKPTEEPTTTEEAKDESPPEKMGMLDSIIGDTYDQREVQFVMAAAVLGAVNNGFINGVTLSGLLATNWDVKNDDTSFFLNPQSAMVSGVAGYVTNNATFLVSSTWDKYVFNLCMFLSYTGGATLVTLISPKAKPYAIAPGYSICWILGGTMLLAASMLSVYGYPTLGIWHLCIAANGVQNGVSSVYSANLIRCTLTGAMTDIGLILGQVIRRGKSEKLARGTVLAVIVISFWVGGLISYSAVRAFQSYTLIINAVLFYLVGVINVVYLVYSLNLSFAQAIGGNWDWTTVLNKIQPSGSKEDMLELFDILDDDDGGSLSMYELEKGLEGKVTAQELKTLVIAADEDGDGEISKQEWENLVEQLFIVDES